MSDFFSNYHKKFEAKGGIPGFSLSSPYFAGLVPGDVGIEIELEGTALPTQGHLERIQGQRTGAHWRVIRDGSLRNGGLEYVLSSPANIDEVPFLADGLWDVFKQLSTTLEVSNRCSTHVHVNMSNRKINEISSVLALWLVFEEALINWCGETRKSNHFCLSARESPQVAKGWLSFLTTGEHPTSEDYYKYASVNLAALSKFGSLEFRCGAGAKDPSMVKDWTKFLYFMCRYAMISYKNPTSLAYSLSEEGGLAIFKKICDQADLPLFYSQVLNTTPDFSKTCLAGFRNAQPFVMGIRWNEWEDEINKEYIPKPFGQREKTN